tara:strand:- start:8001 stop:8345 length:345 start_codon:yes stop_codon:yes gene_type:complete
MATDYAYDIQVSKDKQYVTLAVELPVREKARDPILEMNDQSALNLIRENGFGTYELVKGGNRLTNWVSREGVGGNRSGEWLFRVTKKASARTAAKKTTRKKTTAKVKTTETTDS